MDVSIDPKPEISIKAESTLDRIPAYSRADGPVVVFALNGPDPAAVVEPEYLIR
jgi:hypothetical protein